MTGSYLSVSLHDPIVPTPLSFGGHHLSKTVGNLAARLPEPDMSGQMSMGIDNGSILTGRIVQWRLENHIQLKV